MRLWAELMEGLKGFIIDNLEEFVREHRYAIAIAVVVAVLASLMVLL